MSCSALFDFQAKQIISPSAMEQAENKIGVSRLLQYPRVMMKIIVISLVWTIVGMVSVPERVRLFAVIPRHRRVEKDVSWNSIITVREFTGVPRNEFRSTLHAV